MLWHSYLATGEKEKAIQVHQPWMAIKDSIYTYRRDKSILAINVSYETEKKEEELARLSEDNLLKESLLKQSRWIIAGLVLLVLFIVILAVVLIRQHKLRNEQRTLLLQQRLFRLQMNPHFLFNSLASIQNFIIKQKAAQAKGYNKVQELINVQIKQKEVVIQNANSNKVKIESAKQKLANNIRELRAREKPNRESFRQIKRNQQEIKKLDKQYKQINDTIAKEQSALETLKVKSEILKQGGEDAEILAMIYQRVDRR